MTTPDAAKVETQYDIATSGSEKGTVTIVIDQAGKLRRSVTNALGQVIRVDEPDNNNSLGSIDAPVQPTKYEYDGLNNLEKVVQGEQIRTFVYDSLSRLTSATNPESGTISYSYDNNNNLVTKTDARGITTAMTYDRLNRVKTRTYTGETGPPTPQVSYHYDGVGASVTFGKGKLTKVANANSMTEYTAFDALGRVTEHKQTTDGMAYATRCTYNLSGALIEETYPSGRKVKNVLDSDGDVSAVQSAKCMDAASATSATCTTQAGPWNFAHHFTYNSAGAVTSMQLGNGRWENTTFNSRLQPTQIALGATQGTTNLLKLDYEYGTTNNNGNVLSQTITVPTVGANTGFTAVQTYNYDSLNRLKDATEMLTPYGGSQAQSWKQTFTFDRYGNRRFDLAGGATTVPASGCTEAVCNPTIDPSNNRINSTGYNFDNAGNTTRDASDRKFTYDGENKQVKVESLSPGTQTVTGTIGEYFYDGDGRRIKKRAYTSGVLSEETIFVYDAAAKLVAEYSNQVASPQDAKVAYLTNDHLGSPRINTDAGGNITARHDYHPFGEEIATSQRTSGIGYADDTVRKQFTGYERDNESESDFAQARYYKKKIGRFYSADPENADAELESPQSWNGYTYARNTPLVFTDPTGESVTICSSIGSGRVCVTYTNKDFAKIRKACEETGACPEFSLGHETEKSSR